MQPKYLIISHHPKEFDIAVCATVHNVFLGLKAVYPNADYLFVKLPEKEFKRELAAKTDEENVVLLFNGCGSLIHKNAIYALNYANKKQIPVVVYWHETAWMINKISTANYYLWKKIEKFLQRSNVRHWVTSSQAKQIIMYICKKNFEDILVVNEAINLANYVPAIRRTKINDKIKIVGSGIIQGDKVWRKGVDYFCKIAENLSQIDSINCHYDWFGGHKENVHDLFYIPTNCNFLGFFKDFSSQLRNYDIFLLTSRDDPAPLVAFEALACNLPVFCFDSVGTREIIPNEFVASNPDEMIENIINYWHKKHTYSPNYFRNISEKYSTETFLYRIHNNHSLIHIENFKFGRYSRYISYKKTLRRILNKYNFF